MALGGTVEKYLAYFLQALQAGVASASQMRLQLKQLRSLPLFTSLPPAPSHPTDGGLRLPVLHGLPTHIVALTISSKVGRCTDRLAGVPCLWQ